MWRSVWSLIKLIRLKSSFVGTPPSPCMKAHSSTIDSDAPLVKTRTFFYASISIATVIFLVSLLKGTVLRTLYLSLNAW